MTYFIWKSAENAEGAKRFLIDLVSASKGAFQSSGFQNLPIFAGSVPQIKQVLEGSGPAGDPNRYSVLAEGSSWTTSLGHPGHTNGAIGEVMSSGLIPAMFAKAATGIVSPEAALDEAPETSPNAYKINGRVLRLMRGVDELVAEWED